MKKLLFLTLLFISSIHTFAQPRGENREAIMALKVGMITEKLSLSTEQAEEFWPIYNQFSKEKRDLNRAIRIEMRSSVAEGVSDKDRLASQDKVLAMKTQEIELTKKYRERLLNIISTKQYSDLQVAEENFNRMLLQELKKRREGSH